MSDPQLLRSQVLRTLASVTEALVQNLEADSRYRDKLKAEPPSERKQEDDRD